MRSIALHVGVWRSWLARTLRVREVAGSSPASPTIKHLGRNAEVFFNDADVDVRARRPYPLAGHHA